MSDARPQEVSRDPGRPCLIGVEPEPDGARQMGAKRFECLDFICPGNHADLELEQAACGMQRFGDALRVDPGNCAQIAVDRERRDGRLQAEQCVEWQAPFLSRQVEEGGFAGKCPGGGWRDAEFGKGSGIAPAMPAVVGAQAQPFAVERVATATLGDPGRGEWQPVRLPLSGEDVQGRLRKRENSGGRFSSQALRPSWPSAVW